jgi:predicted  nucleic acid-binding Zn-ribbon protein
MSVAKEVVFKTNTEVDSILIITADGKILYVSRGQYGGWIIKEPLSNVEGVKALWCYDREVKRVEELSELEKYDEIKKFLDKIREYGLEEPSAEEITYFYHPVKIEVKKTTDRYTVIDITPEDRTITAKAVRLYWLRHYSRKGNCSGMLCSEQDRQKLALIAKMLEVQVYTQTSNRYYTTLAKFVIDHAEVEKYLSEKKPATVATPATATSASEEVHVEVLERELQELREPEVIEIKPPTAVTEAQRAQLQQAHYCADEEYEKLKREVEELREIVEKRFDEWARRQGLVKLKLVVFRLPTEYLGSKTIYNKTEDGKIVESKVLNVNPTVARSLRAKFYDVLHETAFKIYDMWALRHDADVKKLNEVMSAINETFRDILAGERAITLVDAYFPKDYVVNALAKYIEERRATMSEVYEKLSKVEKAKEKSRLLRELEELKAEIEALERELRYLQSL